MCLFFADTPRPKAVDKDTVTVFFCRFFINSLNPKFRHGQQPFLHTFLPDSFQRLFSLGAGTSIGAETYDRDVVYIGNGGSEDFAVGPEGEKRPAQREGRRPLQDSPAADTQVTTPRIRLNAQSSSVGCPLAMPPDRDCACPAGGCIISELRCNSSH